MLLTRIARNLLEKKSRALYTLQLRQKNEGCSRKGAILLRVPEAKADFWSSRNASHESPERPSMARTISYRLIPQIFFRVLYSLYTMQFVLKKEIDPDFKRRDFMQLVERVNLSVATGIATKDLEGLSRSLVPYQFMQQMRNDFKRLPNTIRNFHRIQKSDLVLAVVVDVKISSSDEAGDESKTVEMSTFSYYIKGRKNLRLRDDPSWSQHIKDNSLFCLNNFVRVYKKDCPSNWTLYKIQHFNLVKPPGR